MGPHLNPDICMLLRSLLRIWIGTTVASVGFAAEARVAFRFHFGAGTTPGSTAVPVSAVYSREAGFGFEPGAELALVPIGDAGKAGSSAAITSTRPFQFSVKLPEGNYRVTVTLGDPRAAAVTTVKAETRRLMVERLRTRAGEFARRTFTVNVRGPRLADGSEVNLDSREMNLTTREPIARHWDDKLTLAFTDEHPAVAAIEIDRVNDAITLFLTGDSTVTDQPNSPGGSWGQMVTRWFKPEVAVANHAESGETLKGFLRERRWDKILESIKPGDFVLIEFGTNDSKSRGPQNIYPGQDFSETHAPAETTYKELLRRFVADARQRGAQPLLASPSARRNETTAATSLAAWAKAAMDVAKELNVPGIDLNGMGVQLNRALGADAGKQFADQTHHVEYGAYLQAKCIVLGIRQSGLPLARYIVEDFRFDPDNPEPLPQAYDVPADPRFGPAGRAGVAPVVAPKGN